METRQYWFSCAAVLLLMLALIQVWPMAQPQRTDTQQWVNVALPRAQVEQGEPGGRVDWLQIVRLRPAAPPALPWTDGARAGADRLEELRITAHPQPEIASLVVDHWAEETPVPRPHIQVKGYLPLYLQVPEYPAMALARGLEGRVVVEFTIDTQGNIQNPVIIARPASRAFDKAVLSALKKSRYQPQTLDGVPVTLQGVTEEFVFQLQNPPPRRP